MNLGCLPQEEFVMMFASWFLNTDFICYLFGNYTAPLELKLSRWNIKNSLLSFMLFPILIFSKKILVCSPDILKKMNKYFFYIRKKLSLLPVPVDTYVFSPANRKAARKRLALPQNKKIVIFVGRLEHEKGIDITQKLAEINKDILFILIGKSLNEKDIKLDLENVKIYSSLSNTKLADYYRAADLCIFPSRVEAFGLVPREAMACGTPTIVSDIEALKLIKLAIKSPIDGEEFNKRINEFFNLIKKEKVKLGEKSREFVINECGIDLCKKMYSKILLSKN